MIDALRDYQVEGIDRLYQSVAEGRTRPVLMAPTGAGKTRIAAEIINRALEKQKRVAFCVPAITLIDQTVRAFAKEGIWAVGVMQASHPMTDGKQPVQVCSIQTLERRGYPQVDLVIIDECHRNSKLVERWIHDPAWEGVPFIGLSATPWTKGMAKHYNDLIIVATTRQLIAKGYLSNFRVFAPGHPDLSNVRTVAGDYHEGDLSEVMSPLTADIVETWLKCAEGRPTLCYAVDCAHAQHLQLRFEAAGVKAAYQDAFTSDMERDAIRRRFHTGDIDVVCNVGTLTTGVDWDVRCIILARPTKSEMLFVQIIGRGLRTAEGKQDCLILDHSDNHTRLGFVTDIHHAALDDGTKKQKKASAPLPKECPKCAFLRPRGVRVCPNCGYEPKGPPQWKSENNAGELVEISPRHSGPVVREDGVKGVALHGIRFTDREFYLQLKGYAEDRGYKPGWAAHKFKEMKNYWPDRQWQAEESLEPDPTVSSWIRSRQIAWAKRRTYGEASTSSAVKMEQHPPGAGD